MKHLLELIGLSMIVALAALFLIGADSSVVPVTCGEDLDATVNVDDPAIGTRFELEGPCTYLVDTTVELNEGDEIAGPEATFIERGPAFDPEPALDPEPTVERQRRGYTADCDDIVLYPRHMHTLPRCDYALIYGSESR